MRKQQKRFNKQKSHLFWYRNPGTTDFELRRNYTAVTSPRTTTGGSLIKKLSMVFSPGQAPTCYRTGSAAEQRINSDTPQPQYCYSISLINAYTHAQSIHPHNNSIDRTGSIDGINSIDRIDSIDRIASIDNIDDIDSIDCIDNYIAIQCT